MKGIPPFLENVCWTLCDIKKLFVAKETLLRTVGDSLLGSSSFKIFQGDSKNFHFFRHGRGKMPGNKKGLSNSSCWILDPVLWKYQQNMPENWNWIHDCPKNARFLIENNCLTLKVSLIPPFPLNLDTSLSSAYLGSVAWSEVHLFDHRCVVVICSKMCLLFPKCESRHIKKQTHYWPEFIENSRQLRRVYNKKGYFLTKCVPCWLVADRDGVFTSIHYAKLWMVYVPQWKLAE